MRYYAPAPSPRDRERPPRRKMPRVNGKAGDVQWHCRAASGQWFSLGLWGRTGGRETSEPSWREGKDRSGWVGGSCLNPAAASTCPLWP